MVWLERRERQNSLDIQIKSRLILTQPKEEHVHGLQSPDSSV